MEIMPSCPLQSHPCSSSFEALGPSPLALDVVLLVHPREEILFQVPEGPARNGLVVVAAQRAVESLLRHAAVFELGEHDFAVAGQERAGSVAVVRGFDAVFLAGQAAEDVGDEHRRLGGDCCNGLGSGKGRCVACRPDVCVLLVLGGVVVDIDVACCVCEGGGRDESVGFVLGGDVQQIEGLLHGFRVVGLGECGGVAFD